MLSGVGHWKWHLISPLDYIHRPQLCQKIEINVSRYDISRNLHAAAGKIKLCQRLPNRQLTKANKHWRTSIVNNSNKVCNSSNHRSSGFMRTCAMICNVYNWCIKYLFCSHLFHNTCRNKREGRQRRGPLSLQRVLWMQHWLVCFTVTTDGYIR